MLLLKSDLENIERKTIIKPRYECDDCDNYNLKFDVSYQIKNNSYNIGNNFFEACKYYDENETGNIDYMDRLSKIEELTKAIYRFSLINTTPTFLKIGDSYYLLNEIKFIQYDKKDEYSIIKKQYETFKKYFMKHIYGIDCDIVLLKEKLIKTFNLNNR